MHWPRFLDHPVYVFLRFEMKVRGDRSGRAKLCTFDPM